MSDSFVAAMGRKVISRASAQNLGSIAHLLVDAQRGAVTGLVVGKGRKAQLVDWDQVSGFGPDAVMISDDGSLRAPVDDHEKRAAAGGLELVGKRALSDAGNELGIIDDVTFDPAAGALLAVRIGSLEIPAGALLGSGSYAVVLSADQTSA